jgi:23S rRNA pseudouridine1911/1915/1917 synthase
VIDLGGVFVDRARVKVAGRPVRAGQRIEVNLGGAVERAGRDEVPPAPEVVFVDDHIIVADKPAGLVTAPTPESDRGDLLDQLSQRYGDVYLVHRLDLPTSGLLVFARTRDANKRLGDAFVRHDVDREYRAVAIGALAAQTVDRPVHGKRAVTQIAVVEPLAGATLVSLRLETGRTHQIRIHLAEAGHPLVGEKVYIRDYTGPVLTSPRLLLHAATLGFDHPVTGARIELSSALPPDFQAVVERFTP